MGYLGGFVFLNGEGVLDKPLTHYVDEISLLIFITHSNNNNVS